MLHVSIELQRGSFHLSLDVQTNVSVTAVFGPSGSGKSTLLDVIAGLTRPQRGRIQLGEKSLYDTSNKIHISPEKRRIGYLFQDNQLFPHMSVEENLRYGYDLCESKDRKFEFDTIVDMLEIRPLLSRDTETLSGGEAQRTALGRALLSSPDLLLLDEPLASLDEALRKQILSFLLIVKRETQIPMIYVSHAIGEILQLTDHLIVLDKGRVLGQGSFLEVMKKEEILNLAKSLGLENVIQVEVVRHDESESATYVKVGESELHIPLVKAESGKKINVSVRPEEISLALQPVSGISIQNQVPGRISDIRQTGGRVLVQIDIGAEILAEVSLTTLRSLKLEKGKQVYCLIKSRSFTHMGN